MLAGLKNQTKQNKIQPCAHLYLRPIMSLSGVVEVKEFTEFTEYADSAGILTSGFNQCFPIFPGKKIK